MQALPVVLLLKRMAKVGQKQTPSLVKGNLKNKGNVRTETPFLGLF